MRAMAGAVAAILLATCIHAAPPNILFLFADDMRPDAIAALGNTQIKTPNLDRLAASGVVFTNAYIRGSRNGAVCMPSRAMMMTGRRLNDFDDTTGTIPAEFTMFPESLRAAGYDTFICGKWHNDKASLNRAFSTGARIFFGGMHDPFSIPLHPYDPNGVYPDDAIQVQPGVHATTLLADAAIDFLKTRNDKPFLAYVAFTVPHDPRVAPEKYRALYKAEDIKLPENFLPQHPFDNGEMRVRDEMLAGFPRTEEEVRQHIADYYAVITHMDAQVGRILDALGKSGRAENTIIVFAADHGLALGSHGLMGKQNCYEHSIKLPLVIR